MPEMSQPDDPNYSIVIPVLNGEHVLPKQFKALAAQTYSKPFEILVADNRSTDRTKEVVEEFAASMPHLRYIKAHDVKGPAHARNVAVRAARAPFILFCDCDDEVRPDWLEKLDAAVRAGAPAVGGQIIRWLPGRDEPVGTSGLDVELDFLPKAITANCGVRKDIIEEIGGFDEAFLLGDDTDLFWRVQLAGHELVYVPDALVDYAERDGERAMFRQRWTYGVSHVDLYRKHRANGMPRPNPVRTMLRVIRFVLTILRKPWSQEQRREPLRGLALLAGHATQSWRTRTVYF